MNKYLISKQNETAITSRNARELKRRIKSSKPQYKKYITGNYDYINKKGKVCFSINYTIEARPNNKGVRVIGKELKIKE